MRSRPSRSAVPGAMRPSSSRSATSESTAGGTSAPDVRRGEGRSYVAPRYWRSPVSHSTGAGRTGPGASEQAGEGGPPVGDLDQPHALGGAAGVLPHERPLLALPGRLGQPPAGAPDPPDLPGEAHPPARDHPA